jgi:hypothetical protein
MAMVFVRNATAGDPIVDPLNEDTQIGCVFVQIFKGVFGILLGETATLKLTRPMTSLLTSYCRRSNRKENFLRETGVRL